MRHRSRHAAKWLLILATGFVGALGTCAQIAARSTINGFFDAFTPFLRQQAEDAAGIGSGGGDQGGG